MKSTKLTSVKIIQDIYKKFKGVAVINEFTLQKLVNRAMDLYVYDDKFRKTVDEYDVKKVGVGFKW